MSIDIRPTPIPVQKGVVILAMFLILDEDLTALYPTNQATAKLKGMDKRCPDSEPESQSTKV